MPVPPPLPEVPGTEPDGLALPKPPNPLPVLESVPFALPGGLKKPKPFGKAPSPLPDGVFPDVDPGSGVRLVLGLGLVFLIAIWAAVAGTGACEGFPRVAVVEGLFGIVST